MSSHALFRRWLIQPARTSLSAHSKPPLSVIFLTDICPPGSPAEITSPVTSKAQTGARAASLPVASAHSNSVGTLAATTTNTSSAALIYETGIFYWRATRRADSYGDVTASPHCPPFAKRLRGKTQVSAAY